MQRLTISLVHRAAPGGDRQLTERTILPGRTLRIGSQVRDDLVLPVAEIGALGATVQAVHDGSATIQLERPPAGARGAVGYQLAFGQDGRRIAEDQARASGLLLDDDHVIRLRPGTRVVVGLGAYRLLVHLGEAVDVPGPHVPAMPRRRLRDIIDADPVWWLSLAFVGALVTVLVTQALVYNQQIGRFLDPTPSEFVQERTPYIVEVAPAPMPELEPEPEPEPETPPLEAPPPKSPDKPVAPERAEPRREHKAPVAQVDPAEARRRSVVERLHSKTILGGMSSSVGASPIVIEGDGPEAQERVFGGTGGAAGRGEGGPGREGLVLHGDSPGATVEKIRPDTRPHFERNAVATRMATTRRETQVKIDFSPMEPVYPVGPGERPKVPVARLSPKVRRCYEQALRVNPSLQGKVEVHAVIGRVGRFERVTVLGMGPPLSECVQAALMRVRGLPVLAGPVAVKMAFVLKPG